MPVSQRQADVLQSRIDRDVEQIRSAKERGLDTRALEQRLQQLRAQQTNLRSGGKTAEQERAAATFQAERGSAQTIQDRQAAYKETMGYFEKNPSALQRGPAVAENVKRTQRRQQYRETREYMAANPGIVRNIPQEEAAEEYERNKEAITDITRTNARDILQAKQRGAIVKEVRIAPYADPGIVIIEPKQTIPKLYGFDLKGDLAGSSIISPSHYESAITETPESQTYRLQIHRAKGLSDMYAAKGNNLQAFKYKAEMYGIRIKTRSKEVGKGFINYFKQHPVRAGVTFTIGAATTFVPALKPFKLIGKTAIGRIGGAALTVSLAGAYGYNVGRTVRIKGWEGVGEVGAETTTLMGGGLFGKSLATYWTESGRAQLVMGRLARNRENINVVQRYGIRESTFSIKGRMNLNFEEGSLLGKGKASGTGPKYQYYQTQQPVRGPAIITTPKRGVIGTVIKGVQRTTLSTKYLGDTYYLRTTTSRGRSTAKLFLGDKPVATQSFKAEPLIKFTEPLKAIGSKQTFSALDYRADVTNTLSQVRSTQTRRVPSPRLFTSAYYPIGYGKLGMKESIVTTTQKPATTRFLSKPFTLDFNTGKMTPSSISLELAQTEYQYVKGFPKPKAFGITETSEGIKSYSPATSYTRQLGQLRAEYTMEYRKVPSIAESMTRAKKGQFSATRLLERQSIKRPKSVRTGARTTLSLYGYATAPKLNLSFIPVSINTTDTSISSALGSKSITKNLSKLKNEQAQYSIQNQANMLNQKQTSFLKQTQFSMSMQRQVQYQRQNQKQIRIQQPLQTSMTSMRTFTITPPTAFSMQPPTPPVTKGGAGFYLPSFTQLKKRSKKTKTKKLNTKPRYAPSLEAAFFNIKGKPDLRLAATGLTLRPIPR